MSFRLKNNEKNATIAEYLQATENVLVERNEKEIVVKFDHGFTITRLELGSIIRDLTDSDWRELINEVKGTIKGGKVEVFSHMSFGVRPTRSELLIIRLDPSEKQILQEAATLEGKTLSEFVRNAALRVAGEVFNRKSIERTGERVETHGSYVS